VNFDSIKSSNTLNLKLGSVAIGFLLSALFLWLALRDIEFNSLRSSLQLLDLSYVFHVVVALCFFYAFKVQRWRTIIPKHLPTQAMTLATPMMVGFAANNLLPMRVGELVRIYFAGKLLNAPKVLVLSTIVVEKLFDIVAIALIFIIAVLFIAFNSATIGNTDVSLLMSVFVVVIASLAIATLIWFARTDYTRLIYLLPLKWQSRVNKLVKDFAMGLYELNGKRQIALILGNSILQWLILSLCIYFSLAAVGIQPLNYSTACIVLGFLVLGVSLPSAPAFVGSVEYAFVFALGLFGQPAEPALTVALFFHVISFTYVISMAGLCLMYYGIRRTRMLRR